MKATFIIIILCILSFNFSYAKDNRSKNPYEIEIAEIGQQGNLVIKTWCYNKKPQIDDDKFLESAVRGVLFDGLNDSGRMKGRKPLVVDGYNNHQDYFDDFFKNGVYKNYAKLALEGYVQQNNLIKVGKQYKIAKIVVISYNNLRAKLENDNIINRLDNGF